MTFINVQKSIEAQVYKNPDAVALEFNGQVITYQGLDTEVNKLSEYLCNFGAGPGDKIIVCLSKGIDLIICILAVVKSGAAYIPMDPDYPQDRLDLIVEDSKPLIILTETQQAHIQSNTTRVIYFDSLKQHIIDNSGQKPEVDLPLSNIVYYIYTSGSTGRPKAVMVSHLALSNFVASITNITQITDKDRFLSVSSISFDIFGFDLFVSLTNGATLVLTSSGIKADYKHLSKIINKDITVFLTVPYVWNKLIESGWSGNKKLKIMSIGEALPLDLGKKLLGCGKEVWNMYGPAETTIISSYSKINADDENMTIGFPIENTVFYILDDYGIMVPKGENGELYIGGKGLAEGYSGNPELTDERFLVDPFSNIPGSRMYKTGDIVRECEDGRYEYIGRADNQIKIRGNRLEPGEIENTIMAHHEINLAVVLKGQKGKQDECLIAFIQLSEISSVSIAQNNTNKEIVESRIKNELRAICIKSLPLYMLPEKFIFLEKFPVTPNGKIDRNEIKLLADNKLSAMDRSKVTVKNSFFSKMFKLISDR